MKLPAIPQTRANVTLLGLAGERIQTRFRKAVGEQWILDINPMDLERIYELTTLELNVVLEQEIYHCKARLGGIDERASCCLVEDVEPTHTRPLRTDDRISGGMLCALILRADDEHKSEYIGSDENIISNISTSGALVSTNKELVIGRHVMLLLSLKGDDNKSLEIFKQRIYLAGNIVRKSYVGQRGYDYHYGIQFGAVPPVFHQLLEVFIEYRKQNLESSKKRKTAVA